MGRKSSSSSKIKTENRSKRASDVVPEHTVVFEGSRAQVQPFLDYYNTINAGLVKQTFTSSQASGDWTECEVLVKRFLDELESNMNVLAIEQKCSVAIESILSHVSGLLKLLLKPFNNSFKVQTASATKESSGELLDSAFASAEACLVFFNNCLALLVRDIGFLSANQYGSHVLESFLTLVPRMLLVEGEVLKDSRHAGSAGDRNERSDSSILELMQTAVDSVCPYLCQMILDPFATFVIRALVDALCGEVPLDGKKRRNAKTVKLETSPEMKALCTPILEKFFVSESPSNIFSAYCASDSASPTVVKMLQCVKFLPAESQKKITGRLLPKQSKDKSECKKQAKQEISDDAAIKREILSDEDEEPMFLNIPCPESVNLNDYTKLETQESNSWETLTTSMIGNLLSCPNGSRVIETIFTASLSEDVLNRFVKKSILKSPESYLSGTYSKFLISKLLSNSKLSFSNLKRLIATLPYGLILSQDQNSPIIMSCFEAATDSRRPESLLGLFLTILFTALEVDVEEVSSMSAEKANVWASLLTLTALSKLNEAEMRVSTVGIRIVELIVMSGNPVEIQQLLLSKKIFSVFVKSKVAMALAQNATGSFLLQKLLSIGSPVSAKQKKKLIDSLCNNLMPMVFHASGSFVVTAMYDAADSDQKSRIGTTLAEQADAIRAKNFVVYKKCEIDLHKTKKRHVKDKLRESHSKRYKMQALFADVLAGHVNSKPDVAEE